jgi:hypothetical protein
MKRLLAVLAAFGLVACGGTSKEEPTGAVTMNIVAAEQGAPTSAIRTSALRIEDVGSFTQAQTVTNAKLLVKGPHDYLATYEYTALPAQFSYNPCPVGAYTYVVTATIGSAQFKAEGGFAVKAGEVTHLNTVMMQQTNPSVKMDLKAPFIEKVEIAGLNSAGSGGWGETLGIVAKINWPDNDKPDMDNLRVAWGHECIGTASQAATLFDDPLKKFYVDFGNGGFVLPYAESWAFLKSYCQGVERITLTATNYDSPSCSEPGCEIVSSVSFTVPYDKQGYDVGVIDFNYSPNVLCDRIENAEPLPGGAVVLNALVTDMDSPASGWTYEWTSSCGGSFADANALDTTFYAPGLYNTPCKLTLEAWDGEGGYNKGYVSLKTAPAAFGLTIDPYIDVCNSSTWACNSVETYEFASATVAGGALVLNKAAADGNGVAFGPNAHIVGVAGMTLAEASFDAVGSVGGGSPRFLVNGNCQLELYEATVNGNNYSFDTSACPGVMSTLDIISDMGGQPGEVTITNVKVNGIPVSM